MTSDEETTNMEVVDLEKLCNFVVDNFFIWIHLVPQTINLHSVCYNMWGTKTQYRHKWERVWSGRGGYARERGHEFESHRPRSAWILCESHRPRSAWILREKYRTGGHWLVGASPGSINFFCCFFPGFFRFWFYQVLFFAECFSALGKCFAECPTNSTRQRALCR